MIGKRSKPKRGRPATGRDPLLSIRIPQELLNRLREMHRSLRQKLDRTTVSDIAREAISLGLDHISGAKPYRGWYLAPGLRPEHRAEIYEAGHAVAAFLFAAAVFPFTGDSDIAPDDWVEKVVLRRRGAGLTVLGPAFQVAAGRLDILKMLVAGAVADLIYEKSSFWDVWNSAPCRGDRRDVAKRGFIDRADIEAAATAVRRDFEQSDTWQGLLSLARGLTHGSQPGQRCWEDFVDGLENWQAPA